MKDLKFIKSTISFFIRRTKKKSMVMITFSVSKDSIMKTYQDQMAKRFTWVASTSTTILMANLLQYQ